MKRRLVLWGAATGLASAIVLATAVGAPADGAKPVVPATRFQTAAFGKAAAQASGRRVLFLEADPGKQRVAAIHESGRDAGSWAMFPGAPQTSPGFAVVLSRLASAAGAAWRPDAPFPEETGRALALFGVKAVLVDDAGKGAVPLRLLDLAEPVLRVDGDAAAEPDPVTLAARLRGSVARESAGWTWSGWDDRLWGGDVTVRTAAPARFVFPYPAEGARVLVNGSPAEAAPGTGPLLVLALPAGESRVEISLLDPGTARTAAMAGGAGLLAGFILMLVGLRPSRAEVEAAAEGRMRAALPPGGGSGTPGA